MAAQIILTISLFGIYAAEMYLEGSENRLGECEGLLWLLSSCGLSMEYRERPEHLNFKVKAAKTVLEGCYFFRLFERKNNRGRSFSVYEIGEHRVHLKRVRSLAKIYCTQEADKSTGPHITQYLNVSS